MQKQKFIFIQNKVLKQRQSMGSPLLLCITQLRRLCLPLKFFGVDRSIWQKGNEMSIFVSPGYRTEESRGPRKHFPHLEAWEWAGAQKEPLLPVSVRVSDKSSPQRHSTPTWMQHKVGRARTWGRPWYLALVIYLWLLCDVDRTRSSRRFGWRAF